MDIISRIDKIMEKQGLTHYQLAKLAGLSQSTVSNMYQRNTIPSIPTFQSICKALDITMAQFFAAEDETFIPVNPKQKEVLDLYMLLEPDQQDAVLNIIKTMRPGK